MLNLLWELHMQRPHVSHLHVHSFQRSRSRRPVSRCLSCHLRGLGCDCTYPCLHLFMHSFIHLVCLYIHTHIYIYVYNMSLSLSPSLSITLALYQGLGSCYKSHRLSAVTVTVVFGADLGIWTSGSLHADWILTIITAEGSRDSIFRPMSLVAASLTTQKPCLVMVGSQETLSGQPQIVAADFRETAILRNLVLSAALLRVCCKTNSGTCEPRQRHPC